jgi:hypothetical protein
MTLAKFVRCPRPYPKESCGVFPMPKSIFLVIGSQKKKIYFKSQAQAIPFVTFLELHIHFFVATISINVFSSLFMPLLLSFLVCHHHHQDDHSIVVIENMNIPLMVIRVVFNIHNHESQRKNLKTILRNEKMWCMNKCGCHSMHLHIIYNHFPLHGAWLLVEFGFCCLIEFENAT